MPIAIIVSGGRDYADRDRVFEVLDEIHAEQGICELTHGAAAGADTYADQWCDRNQEVVVRRFPANWNLYGRHQAGKIRNSEMLRMTRPNLVLLFPGNTGTNDMRVKAIGAGCKIREIR